MTGTDGRGDLSRRSFMWATAGSAAAAAGGAGTVSAQEENGEEENGEEENGEEENGTENGEEENGEEENGDEENGAAENGDEGGATETVIVGPDGNNVFEPDDLAIEPGTTVEFIWESDTHNIAVESGPEEWEGHEPIEDTGFEHEHTFQEEGTYEYVCEPHVAAGMDATLTVEEGAGGGGGGGGGAATRSIPDSAMSLAVGTIGAMVSTLALAYFFMKYGGYGEEIE
ncbi:plastocyanin/azurin family copper-binding protein [Natranaeroarchaeum aerophilus]|uniref:Plastocyanin/azurin family copper-binding protein n=1 Tax=Natranaeroarchaeum aerophilus TaxID=2917711 RepID=A0AAE3K663_9EURY|nr:plastocyanin/azurin family copper-binding protein [Natranaeroarchaeum aerophilus]MCL9814917.1 plastocyanin/azurin family copper-binding protein [Natranaeroarchaeum aerophilus]